MENLDENENLYENEKEREALERALNPSNKPSKPVSKTAFLYRGIDDLEDIIKFRYPKASFLIAIDLDTQDTDGFPIINRRKLREANLQSRSTNSYIQGRCVGTEFKGVSLEFQEALCLIKDKAVRVNLSTFKSQGE